MPHKYIVGHRHRRQREKNAVENKDRKIMLLTAAHYQNQEEVLEFANHVNGLELPSDYEVHIAVADNSENWDPEKGRADNLSVFQPSRNLGYLNGCSFALRCWSKESEGSPDWVGVVNTDIELSPEFLTRLLSQAFSDKDAVVAPDILLPSGERQNPHLERRLTRAKILLYRWIFGNRMLGRMFLFSRALRNEKRSLSRNEALVEVPTRIYAPHGSAIFFRRLYFDAGGRLEYGGFLYCEELHVAEQVLQNGLNVVWTPGITLWHNQHSTTGSLDLLKRLDWMHQSYSFIFDTYYRRG